MRMYGVRLALIASHLVVLNIGLWFGQWALERTMRARFPLRPGTCEIGSILITPKGQVFQCPTPNLWLPRPKLNGHTQRISR